MNKKYDFDRIIDRRGTDSYKWNVGKDELPMWVADMDFKAAPEITEALEKRLSHGVFGYSDISDEWYAAYANHWKNRHGFDMKKEGLVFCTGVVPAISSAVRKLTTPNEKVVVQTPVYNIFFNSIVNNGRRIEESPLVYDGTGYSMDLSDLEQKFSDPETTLMLLCNPHNPVGKIWDKNTLKKIGELAKRHGVTVISDEIHCDITEVGKDYVPFASASDECADVSITLAAPTKAFNLAGLQTAAVYAENPFLRHKIWRALNTDEVAEPNAFAQVAAIAAFEKGLDWLDALRAYVDENKRRAAEFISSEIKGLKVVKGEATYLMWIDVSGICPSGVDFAAFVRKETGLFVTGGEVYGSAGKGFIRMNVACPAALLEDGLSRLKAGAEKFIKS